MKYYQLLNSDWEVLGTYQDYATAVANKKDGDILRYFTGSIWIQNVTAEIK